MSVWRDSRGRYHVGLMHRGRRVHRTLPAGSSAEDARRLETRLRQEAFRVLDLGQAPAVSCLAAVQRYLDEEVVHHKAAHITRGKAFSLEPLLANRPLAEIAEVAEELIRRRGHAAAATINRKLSILKRVARLAYQRWGWLSEPLHDRIPRLPGERARHLYLSGPQLERLIAAHRSQAGRDAATLAAFTGLRQAELWALKAEHYQDGLITLPDSKAGLPRAVPVIPRIRSALRRWIRTDKPHRRTVYHDFELARAAIGMPQLRFHDLRHTTASLLLAQGVDLETVGQILGHRSTQTTKRYAHLSLEAARRAMRKLG